MSKKKVVPTADASPVADADQEASARFDPYAPCPDCGEQYNRSVPLGADLSRGNAWAAYVEHRRKAHGD